MFSSNNIVNITFQEFQRHYRHSTRKLWSWFFSIFIQLYNVLTILMSINLSNFKEEEEIIIILSKVFFIVLVYSLPALTLILLYDNFIEDPTIHFMAVASTQRSKLLFGKIMAVFLFTYSIFFLNSLLSLIILFSVYRSWLLFTFFLKGLLIFSVITLFFSVTITTLVLLIHNTFRDKASSLFLPLALFYIVPFLISNSLTFEVLDPTILKVSPMMWVLSFIVQTIFNEPITADIFIVPVLLLFCTFINIRLFNRYEFKDVR